MEDEGDIVKVVKGYLERAGHQTLTAYDGKTGLFMARQEKPDLIVLDLMLPEMDGLDVCRAPTALSHHVAHMEALLGDNPALAADLRASFLAAVNEILAVAATAAFLAAVLTSTFVARRIVGPVREMMHASRRIAAGDYHERVQVPGEDELGELARSFNQMAGTLEQTEQRRLDLIGNVAHELRTPLSSIRGIMEGLVDGVLPAEPATYVRVQREVGRLQRLVGDLQELSRAEAGQIPIDPRPVAPAELVHAAVECLQPQFDDKDIELQIDVPTDLPQVQADPDRITQVLINLLGNALHYTPSGGKVSVQCTVNSDVLSLSKGEQSDHDPLFTVHCLLFTVTDSGIGISLEHLPHIFERFYRVDKSRSRAGGGSGIGLTISRHLIEAHGGRIWAESAGQGSGFKFTLPLA